MESIKVQWKVESLLHCVGPSSISSALQCSEQFVGLNITLISFSILSQRLHPVDPGLQVGVLLTQINDYLRDVGSFPNESSARGRIIHKLRTTRSQSFNGFLPVGYFGIPRSATSIKHLCFRWSAFDILANRFPPFMELRIKTSFIYRIATVNPALCVLRPFRLVFYAPSTILKILCHLDHLQWRMPNTLRICRQVLRYRKYRTRLHTPHMS